MGLPSRGDCVLLNGPGEPWPRRVDTYLAEGVSAEQIDRWVQSASILHSNGDALDIAVSGGRIVGVRGQLFLKEYYTGSRSISRTGQPGRWRWARTRPPR